MNMLRMRNMPVILLIKGREAANMVGVTLRTLRRYAELGALNANGSILDTNKKKRRLSAATDRAFLSSAIDGCSRQPENWLVRRWL
jgi:hypothetical protein